jgi:hypothetical protein
MLFVELTKLTGFESEIEAVDKSVPPDRDTELLGLLMLTALEMESVPALIEVSPV